VNAGRETDVSTSPSLGPRPPSGAPAPVGALELFRTFFVLGLTSFGMAILQNIRSVPVKRGWLSREDIDEGLGLVQMYPGAMGVDLVAYVGYRTRRVRGAIASAAGFVAPSLAMMLALSWLYSQHAMQGRLGDVVVGLDAIVAGVILNVALDFAAQHGRGRIEALLALGAFAVGVAGANLLWAVLGALIVGAALLRRDNEATPTPDGPVSTRAISAHRVVLSLVPGAVVLAAAIAAALAPGALAALVADMAKIGTVAFGNGATILPVLQQDAVSVHHWLSPQAFGAGVAFGQVTPGPFLMTAAFVGFQVAGWWGGILAAVAIFAPSVAMTTVAAELYPSLRHLTVVRGAIRGIMAAFVGLLAVVVLSLAHLVLPAPAAEVLAAAALVATRRFKWNTLAVFGVGLALWAIYLLLGGAA
jgi:chromate transporter